MVNIIDHVKCYLFPKKISIKQIGKVEMNRKDKKYLNFKLISEMLDTIEIVKSFNPPKTKDVSEKISTVGKLLLTGEGSSRLFPAKNAIYKSLKHNLDLVIATEGSRQAMQYDLQDYAVFCASNSGKTKEVVDLAKQLARRGNKYLYALTANKETLLEKTCQETFVLNCGWEQAVAATKSVVEQALFYESILENLTKNTPQKDYHLLARLIEEVLSMPVNRDIIRTAAAAGMIYFAGFNNGVAEELTLKTNEITRKKSDYLEGTYAVHGIEEVMHPDDLLLWIDPIEEEIDKFHEVLIKGVGLNIIAISTKQTRFPTIRIPDAGEMNPYLYLCAGWNLLVEIGLYLGINLDKPQRARKIGNEYTIAEV